MEPRRKLSDILRNGQAKSLRDAWRQTEAAGDFEPLPAGEYNARIISGELCQSKKKETLGYKLTFQIADGEFEGRQAWHDIWLTPAAMAMAKRDLAKIGVADLAQLDNPLPAVFLCKVKLALRRDDDGNVFNRVKSFEVTGLEKESFAPDDIQADTFAPTDENEEAPF